MLKPDFRRGEGDFAKDWMRQFVGLVRSRVSTEQKLHIISFNYDYLLEHTLRMYWLGAEIKYPAMNETIEFVYPHGRFSELPEHVFSAREFLAKQAKQLRLGNNIDKEARERAKAIIAGAGKKYFVGFSFADTNIELLGLTDAIRSSSFVQNYMNADIRLTRKLDQLLIPKENRDDGDMNALVRNGFFEQ